MTDRGPSDACPDCGAHEHISFTDGLVACVCGWSGVEADLCYRVSQEQIAHALEQGNIAFEMLERELAKRKREPEA